MKILLLSVVICVTFIYTDGSPVLITAQHEGKSKEIITEENGKIQEETKGVFKSTTASPASAEIAKETSSEIPASSASAAPLEQPSSTTEAALKKLKETGRQSSSSDDEDDDDDDLDLGVDDDDDDDDDEGTAADDDDEDDDYFERFFDDLLGEDDDDDDDSPSTGSQPVVAPAEPEVQEQAANAQEEAQAGEEAASGETENPVEGTDNNETDSLIDKDPTEVEAAASVQKPQVVQAVTNDATDNEDDEEDDDDEEEADLADLADDDDDDDEDDETETADDDDEDDEDDEPDLEDVLEARRSRALQPGGTRMPAVYISKYNRFVDNIILRINRLLGKSYDPVRVKLPSTVADKSNKRRKTSSKKKKRPSSKTPTGLTNKMGEYSIARMTESEVREPAFVLISKNSETRPAPKNATTVRVRTQNGPSAGKKNKKNKTKSKTKAAKKAPKPRATLFGLSSIKRDGDVTVNMMSNYTTVKTNFVLGPLTLRVEKEFGRGAKRELKSATATTAEMHGRLILKIVHGGAATLHSIKVLQPKQSESAQSKIMNEVRVESADNHEKTKEYMWKRSAHIATVVSQKLASAAKSMLEPPPKALRKK